MAAAASGQARALRTALIAAAAALGMLGLGFASVPLYPDFLCGYGIWRHNAKGDRGPA